MEVLPLLIRLYFSMCLCSVHYCVIAYVFFYHVRTYKKIVKKPLGPGLNKHTYIHTLRNVMADLPTREDETEADAEHPHVELVYSALRHV